VGRVVVVVAVVVKRGFIVAFVIASVSVDAARKR
jgi:hypothetical protein